MSENDAEEKSSRRTPCQRVSRTVRGKQDDSCEDGLGVARLSEGFL